jgi:hypothetical protein
LRPRNCALRSIFYQHDPIRSAIGRKYEPQLEAEEVKSSKFPVTRLLLIRRIKSRGSCSPRNFEANPTQGAIGSDHS